MITCTIKKKLNKIIKYKDCAIVFTSKDKKIFIDIEDVEKIDKYTWNINSTGYARTEIGGRKNKISIMMHRLIMNAKDGEVVDHINHNTVDNRKKNLRICSQKDNVRYARVRTDNISGVTGVGYTKREGKWRARIHVNGSDIGLGYYNNFEDAVTARLDGERKYFGEFGYQARIMK